MSSIKNTNKLYGLDFVNELVTYLGYNKCEIAMKNQHNSFVDLARQCENFL